MDKERAIKYLKDKIIFYGKYNNNLFKKDIEECENILECLENVD